MMLATELNQTLVVVRPFDVGAVKGNLTNARRRKGYQGELDPDFRMIEDSSGVNPFVYFEMVQANKPFQTGLLAWCAEIGAMVKDSFIPDRGFDRESPKDWMCSPVWCEYWLKCEEDGPCDTCSHRGCDSGPQPVERGMSRD
jgi:hypothetical protein